MLLNDDTVLSLDGTATVLVPYTSSHVQVYHGWMADPEILRLTCSERLSLEEEYANQESWRSDPKKLTFIILDSGRDNTMAGDVNLYLNGDEGEGEIEVMVAEPTSRRRGIAASALRMMMAYAADKLGVCRFVAKILEDNLPSVRLFEKIGFVQTRHVKAFGEVHYALDVGEDGGAALEDTRTKLRSRSYKATFPA